MKYIKFLLLTIWVFLIYPTNLFAKEEINLYLFYSETCSACASEEKLLNELEIKYDNLNLNLYEVTNDQYNNDLMNVVKDKLGDNNPYVPYTVIGTKSYTGFNDNVSYQIEEAIKNYFETEHRDIVKEILENKENLEDEIIDDTIDNKVIIPIIGKVDPMSVSLPIIAVIIGTVDGFNPCAMWVLLFLISMLLGMKNRKRMWIIGLTFLLTSALVYMLIMVAWLKVTLSITSILWFKIFIAIVALIGGYINLRNYFKTRKKEVGCTVVAEEKRIKTFDYIRKITSQKNLFLALLGVILLALSVNIIELTCSAGLPLLFTQVLALNDLTSFEYWSYILIYIFFFLLDDLIIFSIAMFTFKLTGISNKYSKYSHLIGGILMIIIGILLIFKPEWLMFNF